ncbi:hypothetical protein M8009_18935, partial [Halomonas sp. ATCH28]
RDDDRQLPDTLETYLVSLPLGRNVVSMIHIVKEQLFREQWKVETTFRWSLQQDCWMVEPSGRCDDSLDVVRDPGATSCHEWWSLAGSNR